MRSRQSASQDVAVPRFLLPLLLNVPSGVSGPRFEACVRFFKTHFVGSDERVGSVPPQRLKELPLFLEHPFTHLKLPSVFAPRGVSLWKDVGLHNSSYRLFVRGSNGGYLVSLPDCLKEGR